MPTPAAEIVLLPGSADSPTIQPATNHLDRAAALVLDAVGSDNTRRAYRRALLGGTGDTLGFLPWLALRGQGMDKAAVNAYRRYLEAAGLGHLVHQPGARAVRKLAVEAAESGWMSDAAAQAVKTARGVKGDRLAHRNWLTRQQARDLLAHARRSQAQRPTLPGAPRPARRLRPAAR
ncbi:MAG: hypothetical protein IPJ58_13135 [Ardenticatenia bacterium]|nr:hypothetical protein [Ardenticatenia bacterium]